MSRKWIGPLAVIAMIVATLAAWESLPTRVPMHWGLSGEVDGWGSRSSLFIMPALAAGMWALFALLIRIGPREGNLDRTRETWWLIANVSILLLLGLHLVMMGAALGWPLDVSRLVLAGTGLTLAITGNYLPRLRPNWWMGIRTPWTLESDEVWRETHRIGGRWMLFGGLAAAACAFLPSPVNVYLFLTCVLLAALVPSAYSYVLWRRLGGDTGRSRA